MILTNMTSSKIIFLLSVLFPFVSCVNKTDKNAVATDSATFEYFSYSSQDPRYSGQDSINQDDYYANPILAGCYPDPSICRKGNDYYLVNSTFVYYPGIPIWHSKDLVNWEQIGYVLDRPSQLSFPKGIAISNGIYAPAISYNPYNDTFYLIVTGVGNGGNFVVKTKDPAAGWSDPIFLPEVGGIDPSFLFDDDGKTYIVNNDDPDYPAEYDGHRAIRIREYDIKTDKVISKSQVIIDKGVHPEDKPIWVEGPHLYHIGDYYYLMAAEGGTEEGHSEVVFISKNPTGPFTPCDINPILTQRTLSPDRPNPITCTGHADLIQTPEGDWWAVFLGVLPYETDKFCNTGRSTFMLPARWENNQPIILDEGAIVPTFVEKPKSCKTTTSTYGNFSYKDEFDGEKDLRWMSLRGPADEWSRIENGKLIIEKREISLSDRATPSMLCQWMKHAYFSAETSVHFVAGDTTEMAGITCYMSDSNWFAFGLSRSKEGYPQIRVITRSQNKLEGGNSKYHIDINKSLPSKADDMNICLKVVAKGITMDFYYSLNNGKKWKKLGPSFDATQLSVAKAGGFTGAVVGLFATSNIEQTIPVGFPR